MKNLKKKFLIKVYRIICDQERLGVINTLIEIDPSTKKVVLFHFNNTINSETINSLLHSKS